jgi:hypothetical protein
MDRYIKRSWNLTRGRTVRPTYEHFHYGNSYFYAKPERSPPYVYSTKRRSFKTKRRSQERERALIDHKRRMRTIWRKRYAAYKQREWRKRRAAEKTRLWRARNLAK